MNAGDILQRVVTNIHKLPGLSRSLLPSLFPDLQRAVSVGPVIISIAVTPSSSYSIAIPSILPCRSHRFETSRQSFVCAQRRRRDESPRVLVTPTLGSDCYAHRRFLPGHPSISMAHLVVSGRRVLCAVLCMPLAHLGRANRSSLISTSRPIAALICARRRDSSSYTTEQKRFIAIGQAKASGANSFP